jgi:predicted MPP superfamily phosphohydrolase
MHGPWRFLRRAAIPALGILLLAVLIDGFLVEPNRLVERALTLPCPGLHAGPVRIALFSDVDFLAQGRRERALRESVLRFRPDVVLVAGDFIERAWATRDPRVLAGAAAWLRSIHAPSGKFLALGEEESDSAKSLREAWGDGAIEIVSNEARRLEVRGDLVDLFVAQPQTEPAPWSIGREGGERPRTFLFMRGRGHDQIVTYRGTGASDWRDVTISFSFQTLDFGSGPDLRFAWSSGLGPWGGEGLRLVASPYHPVVLLSRHQQVEHIVKGRLGWGFVPPVGVWCRARVRLREESAQTRIQARVWKESDPEPDSWPIDAVDTRPARNWQGTVAFAGDHGRCRYADLHVEDASGHALLDEPFADSLRLRGSWGYDSALADWVLEDRSASRAGARILLTHNPDLVLELADLGGPPLDLVMAGHTHGGLVRLPGFGALTTSTNLGRRYDAGLFDFQGIPLYITAGVGPKIVPVRFLDPPEITLLTLVPVNARAGAL